MADPQNVQAPVSFDDAFRSFDKDKGPQPKGGLHPAEPKDISKPISFDDVHRQFEAYKVPEAPNKEPDLFVKGAFSDENRRLGDVQYTNQAPTQESYIGKAIHGRDLFGNDDDTYYLQDDKGNYEAADKNKHLVFRDENSGEYGIYKRDRDQDRSRLTGMLTGLGHFVQEGFQAAPTRLPSTVGTLTRGQEALGAARGIEEATGTRVAVPQNAVTENAITPKISSGLQALPGGSTPFEQAEAQMAGGLGQARNVAASDVAGHVANPESAGEAARTGIETYAKPKEGVLAKRVSDAYDRLDAHMPTNASGDLSETRKVAQEIQTKFEATRGESGTNKIDPTINEVLSAVTDPKGMSYSGLKDLRTRVGEMLESGSTIKDTGISDKQLRGLYRGLTDDMRAMVQEHGGDRGLQLWERANTYARLASERREQLGKIIGLGSTNRSDEAIFNRLVSMAGSTSSADAKTLSAAKKSMPADQWNEIASAAAGRLGNIKTDRGIHFDPGQFVKDYGRLSDRGKALLFGDNQRLRKALDNISDLAKFEPPVHHPGPITHLVTGGLLLSHGERGEGVAGKLEHVLHVLGGVVGMRTLGRMLSKPATAESVAKWMQGYKLLTLKPTKGNVTVFNRLTEGLSNDAAQVDRDNISNATGTAADYAKKLAIHFSPFGKSE